MAETRKRKLVEMIKPAELLNIAKELVEWIYTENVTKAIMDEIIAEFPIPKSSWWFRTETPKKPVDILRDKIVATKPEEFSIRAVALIDFFKQAEGEIIVTETINTRAKFLRRLIEKNPTYNSTAALFSDVEVLEKFQAYFIQELSTYHEQRLPPPAPPMPDLIKLKKSKNEEGEDGKKPVIAKPCNFISMPNFDSASIEIEKINKLSLPTEAKAETAYLVTKNELYLVNRKNYRKFKNISLPFEKITEIKSIFCPVKEESASESSEYVAYSTTVSVVITLSEQQKKSLIAIIGYDPSVSQVTIQKQEGDLKNIQQQLLKGVVGFQFDTIASQTRKIKFEEESIRAKADKEKKEAPLRWELLQKTQRVRDELTTETASFSSSSTVEKLFDHKSTPALSQCLIEEESDQCDHNPLQSRQ